MIKINAGSGYLPLPGYINIDLVAGEPNFAVDIVHDIRKLKEIYKDGTVDEIFAKDTLEHINWRQVPQVLQDWIDLLKPGGVLKIRVPDLVCMVDEYLSHKNDPDARTRFNRVVQLVFGDQNFTENAHLAGFNAEYLKQDIEAMGMEVKPYWFDGGRDIRITAIKKPFTEPLVELDHPDYKYKELSHQQMRELFKK